MGKRSQNACASTCIQQGRVTGTHRSWPLFLVPDLFFFLQTILLTPHTGYHETVGRHILTTMAWQEAAENALAAGMASPQPAEGEQVRH